MKVVPVPQTWYVTVHSALTITNGMWEGGYKLRNICKEWLDKKTPQTLKLFFFYTTPFFIRKKVGLTDQIESWTRCSKSWTKNHRPKFFIDPQLHACTQSPTGQPQAGRERVQRRIGQNLIWPTKRGNLPLPPSYTHLPGLAHPGLSITVETLFSNATPDFHGVRL